MYNLFEENINLIDFSKILKIAEEDLIRLFPLNRSILNEGVLKSLDILKENVDFDIVKIKSGYNCYDWVVPDEWVIKEAYIEANGTRIIDFSQNNLHILNYSEKIDAEMNYDKLLPHLHYL